MLAKYDYRNPAALKTLVGQGVKLFRFPKDMMEQSFKAARRRLRRARTPATPTGRRSTPTSQAWRRDANLWFRFTEAGFDDFMQAQKL